MNTDAGSWKPSSPMMAAVESEGAGPAAPLTPAAAGGNALLQNVLAQQGSTPYWSPSTHAGSDSTPAVSAAPAAGAAAGSSSHGEGLGLAAQEFVPGGAGAMEFMPGFDARAGDVKEMPMQGGGMGQQQAGGGGLATGQAGGSAVDPRMYDQMMVDQGAATYTEEELIKPTPRRRTLGSFFMSNRLLERCQHLNECMLRQLEPGDERMKLIPSGYTSIFPLDAPGQDDSSAAGSFGYP